MLQVEREKGPSVVGKLSVHGSAVGHSQVTRGSYFWASSVHWSNHLQAGMSLMQA